MSLPWITCLAETCWHVFAEQYDADGWGAGSYHLLLLMFILLTQSLSHCWPGLQPHANFVLLIQHQCTPVRGADTVNRKVLTHSRAPCCFVQDSAPGCWSARFPHVSEDQLLKTERRSISPLNQPSSSRFITHNELSSSPQPSCCNPRTHHVALIYTRM